MPIAKHIQPSDPIGRADYVATTYDNVYAMATPSFWSLHPQELLILQMLLHSMPVSTTSAQIPLHLPHTAANRPWYLLMVTLTAGMGLMLPAWRAALNSAALVSVLVEGAASLYRALTMSFSMSQQDKECCCQPSQAVHLQSAC